MEALLLFAVIQNHVKTPRKRNDQLVKILVRMTAAGRSARNIVEIVDALDVKGHMPTAFNEGKIASWIADFGKINNPALG